ncbi:MAG: ankyrin repeat domain-containing protein [Sandaracinaceae bacterium]|nr:ankyrin repeat domain-containing protein [Sandaracinaceae bacterium]
MSSAKTSPTRPAIVEAAAHGKKAALEKLLADGADINVVDHVGHSALSLAAAFSNVQGAEALIELGIDLSLHGPKALRSASTKSLPIVKLLVERGVDIEYCVADMVYPYRATPLAAAASANRIDVVRYLLEQGANAAFVNNYGERPYHYALRNKNVELAELLRSHEPAALHDTNAMVTKWKALGLPDEVFTTLSKSVERIRLTRSSMDIGFIKLCTPIEITQIEDEGHVLLTLVSEIEHYGAAGAISWDTQRKAFVSYDIEHKELRVLPNFSWTAFVESPTPIIDAIFSGELDTLSK